MSLLQEYLTFDDLQGLDCSPEDVRVAFKREIGQNSDGILVNKERHSRAVKPAITKTYVL